MSTTSPNFDIYWWDNNINKFIQYQHNIDLKFTNSQQRVSACFDKNKQNILYMIIPVQIIIVEIENNTYKLAGGFGSPIGV